MQAIGTATRTAHLSPQRLTPMNTRTKTQARTLTGMPGRYH